MRQLRIPRTEYSYMFKGKQYTEMYFGRLLSSSSTPITVPIWDSATTYNYLDEVYIPELHTTYTAKIDDPKGHPSVSRGWFKEGDNEHKMVDATFSTASVFEDTCVVEFEILAMTHILGRGIYNAKEIGLQYFDFNGDLIDTSFNCFECKEIESLITMTYYPEFSCFKCCNPDPVIRESFALKLDDSLCGKAFKVRITITKLDPLKPILISSMCVADEYYLGCVQSGFKIIDKIPSQISEFPEIRATGILHTNMTTEMSGTITIEHETVDKHRRAKNKHGGYLNYYLFDELDTVKEGLMLGLSAETEYSIESGNRVSMSFRAIGVQH